MTITSRDAQPNTQTPLTWDIYCHVIDNYGDVGVCWRLTRNLIERGQMVRLFIDDASALQWMAADVDKRNERLQLMAWGDATDQCGDAVIEAFGAQLPDQAQHALAAAHGARRNVCWLNLEYLSAEPHSKANHGLSSPVASGPAAGMCKQFFYPGFVPGTGGLLRDTAATALANEAPILSWPPQSMALFSYDAPTLATLINQASVMGMTVHVAAGRTTTHVQALLNTNAIGAGHIRLAAHCTQQQFDCWLGEHDFLVVRGEDSLTRAILIGKPFLWQIYPQEDGAHHVKLNAFLDWLEAPTDMRRAFQTLNGTLSMCEDGSLLPANGERWREWALCVHNARLKLLAQDDLVSHLLVHARKVLG